MSVAGALALQGALFLIVALFTFLAVSMPLTERERLAGRRPRVVAAILGALGIVSLLASFWVWVIQS